MNEETANLFFTFPGKGEHFQCIGLIEIFVDELLRRPKRNIFQPFVDLK